ncbi:efflux RND transporter periplasmic adaptor subunit [Rugamonas sp. DEMB1]|uniref:efflux RND transporter periplasmic adaptor subunit n=1 Tax=Rugamonas sp. DEMB1 TaxID=3039386 RepID=UPI00244B0B76|nr:efflux RND transporter periplasmic adaptor subunit [Rugamonas sp. DEMB1]WGG52465.1 efflux RND transporter periplasmic adaptor subunit [Rugamonas sp. DEMB1]
MPKLSVKNACFGMLSLLLILMLVVGVFSKKSSSATNATRAEKITPVIADIEVTVVATGKIVPRNEVEIKALVPGVIDQVFISAGEKIKKNSVIARISLTPDAVVLAAAQSDLEKAKISFAVSKRELDRYKELLGKNFISDSMYLLHKRDYELAKESLDSSVDKLDLIKNGFSKNSGSSPSLVRATISGMALDVPVKAGDYITQTNTFSNGTTIATIADIDDLIFEGSADESDVAKLRTGMPVSVNPGALGTRVFPGILEYISPKGFLDQGIIKFKIKARVKAGNDVFLRSGYSASATVILDSHRQVLAVDEGYVLFEKDGTYIGVIDGEKKKIKKRIQTGISNGVRIEVISGLKISDELVHY